MTKFKVYSQIKNKKTKLNDDGTLTIKGVAATSNPDDDFEIVTPEAIRSLCKQATTRNLHLDHDWKYSGAIGAIKKAFVKNNRLNIVADVLAEYADSIKQRLDLGMNLAFSISGDPKFNFKSLQKDGHSYKIIDDYNLMEISLVAMPSNMDTLGTVHSKSKKTVEGTCLNGVCKAIAEMDDSVNRKSKKKKDDDKKDDSSKSDDKKDSDSKGKSDKKDDKGSDKDQSDNKSSNDSNNDQSDNGSDDNTNDNTTSDNNSSGDSQDQVQTSQTPIQSNNGQDPNQQIQSNNLVDNNGDGNNQIAPEDEEEISALNEDLVVKLFNEMMAEEKGLIVKDILDILRTELRNMGVNITPEEAPGEEEPEDGEGLEDGEEEEFEEEDDFDEDEDELGDDEDLEDDDDIEEEDLEDDDLDEDEDDDFDDDLDDEEDDFDDEEDDLEEEDSKKEKLKKKKEKLKKKKLKKKKEKLKKKKAKLNKKAANKKKRDRLVEAVLREIENKKSKNINSKFDLVAHSVENEQINNPNHEYFDAFGRLITNEDNNAGD